MPGASLSRRRPGKAPLGKPAFQPYWGKPAVRNDRGDRGNVGIIRSPVRASILPDYILALRPVWIGSSAAWAARASLGPTLPPHSTLRPTQPIFVPAGGTYPARRNTGCCLGTVSRLASGRQCGAREVMMKLTIRPTAQRFTISHLDERDFKTAGLRDYSAYRDLGIAEATGGLAEAHVIRMTAPFRPELSVRHHHNVQFQMVYCLKGWFQTEDRKSVV